MYVCFRMCMHVRDVYSHTCATPTVCVYVRVRACIILAETVKRIPLRDRRAAPLALSIATRSAASVRFTSRQEFLRDGKRRSDVSPPLSPVAR